MLQQTQVATVRNYFIRFLDTFPTVFELAAADEQAVLKLWEGLGYYRRARQLHAAAKELVARFDGVFPEDLELIQSLPGIGRYTAGAIASIALGMRAPIVEANTQRLYARYIGLDQPLNMSASQNKLWGFAEHILPNTDCGRFNQALMELGSLVCTPQQPTCQQCPLRSNCRAFQEDRQSDIPVPKPKKQFIQRTEAALVVRRKDKVLVRLCREGERWAGLWDFPRFELPELEPPQNETYCRDTLKTISGIEADFDSHFKTLRHGVTKYRITLHAYFFTYHRGRIDRSSKNAWKWVTISSLSDLPLSTTGRKLALRMSNSQQS